MFVHAPDFAFVISASLMYFVWKNNKKKLKMKKNAQLQSKNMMNPNESNKMNGIKKRCENNNNN